MEVKIESSRIIKPLYDSNPPLTTYYTPLSVFDKINYDMHVGLIYAYRRPTPSNSRIQLGLQKVLSVYREYAGRFSNDEKGDPVILLNDEGVTFVEASVDCDLDQAMPLKPSPSLLKLHPKVDEVKELAQVQLTRFKCGSLVVGFTSHHLVGDAQSASNFLAAWGQATKGGVDNIHPTPFRDRTIFNPRVPPTFKFDHNGLEFMSRNFKNNYSHKSDIAEQIIVHKAHLTREFLANLKAKISLQNGELKTNFTTFESLVAHLWRIITKVRNLSSNETTYLRISVNGRGRMIQKVPNYFGNFVLWAFPTSNVKDLLNEDVSYAANIIHDAIVKVDDSYFKSFIDFANYKAKIEDLISTANAEKPILSPNIDVDSWLRFPFHDLDFGTGCPFLFLPSYLPVEGLIFLLPSYAEKGSVDVFVPLFMENLVAFEENLYIID